MNANLDDIVLVRTYPQIKKDAPASGKVIKIVASAPKPFAATIAVDKNGVSWAMGQASPVYVPNENLNGALNGDHVQALACDRSGKVAKVL